MENVAKRTYQLREKRTSVPLNQRTRMGQINGRLSTLSRKEWLSSSEGHGSADEWKPTQQELEDDSEKEEKQVIQSVHRVAKRKRSESPVLQREVECPSDQKTTQEESEDDSEEEKEQVIRRVHKVAKRKRSESPVWQREVSHYQCKCF